MKKIFYISLMALLLLCNSVFAVKKEIVYVRGTGNYNDSAVIAAIASYADSSLYNVTQLKKGLITQSDLTQLNAADVVIMGRNIGSYDVLNAKGVWDSITKPVIAMNMWGMRNSRAKWLNDGSIQTKGAAGDILKAVIKVKSDKVFAGLSDTVSWWTSQANIFSVKNGGNGVVLAQTLDSIPLFIRWSAGTEFYPGAGHFPLAERTYIGCGYDNSGNPPVNYFGFSADAKKIFFKELGRMAGVPIEIVYVRGTSNYNDSAVIAAIASYADSSMFNVTQLKKGLITQADLAQLNAADVVIMGRNIGSYDVLNAKGVWDSITKPVIAMNMWGMRNSRAKWLNDGSIQTKGAAGDILKAVIKKKSDKVLEGLSDTVSWWTSQANIFSVKNGGNGEVLAQTLDSIPLFIRWAAGTEFYAGAGHFPLAERTYIGCGYDNSGNPPVNYFGFSAAVKEVFIKELLRMGASKPTKLPLRKISSLAALSTSVGIMSPELSANLKYTVRLPFGTTAVPTISATPTDAGAKVVIVNATTLTDSTTIKVVAEDTAVKSVYIVRYVIAAADKDATLSALEISDGTLNPAFSADVTEYTVTLPAGTTAIPTVKTATAKSATSAVVIVDATSFDKDATITVTAQDVTVKKVYKINFELAVGISNNTLSNVSIYPSPVKDFLKITNAGNAVVSIYSISGELINQIKLSDNNASINVSNLVGGTYLINIKSGSNDLNSKFVKR